MKITVKVKPSSGKQDIKKIGGKYIVSLKEKAENNRANIELLKILKKKFKKEVKLIKGLKSKNKIIEIN